MTAKQTPRQLRLPVFIGNLPLYIKELGNLLITLVNKIRNDLDNGATTFPTVDIAGIGNVDIDDFDNGQVRLYKDTDDSDQIHLYARYGDDLCSVELTTI